MNYLVEIENTFLDLADNQTQGIYGDVIEAGLINVKEPVNQIILEYKQREKTQVPLCFIAKKGKGYRGYKDTVFKGVKLLFKTPYKRSQLQHQLLRIEPVSSIDDLLFRIKAVQYSYNDKKNLNIIAVLVVFSFSKEIGGEGFYQLIYDKEAEVELELFEDCPILPFPELDGIKLKLDCINDIFMEKDLKRKIKEIKQDIISFLKGE